jgi:hypothetical protein
MSYWYLGSPYTKYEDGLDAAATMVAVEAARFIAEGITVFAPIPYGHALAQAGGLDPRDYNIWVPMNRPFIEEAIGMIVVKMKGWEVSAGLAEEVKLFTRARKPILYMDVGQDIHEVMSQLRPESRWRSSSSRPASAGHTTSSVAGAAGTSLREAQGRAISRRLDSVCASWKKR